MHAIEINKDRFVVSHGEDGIWIVEVARADEDGAAADCSKFTAKIERSYGGQRASKPEEHLAWPCHLAVDSDMKIYVADHYNNRILKLNAALEKVEEMTLQGECFRPRRMCLIGQGQYGKRLHIGQSYGELVHVEIQ